jgi:hypothetical protein
MPGKLMMEIKPMAKAGQITLLALPKRAPNNNTKPEVDNHLHNLTKELPLEELLDKELELLLLKTKQDPKLETEVPLQTQAILLVTISSEPVLPHNKNNKLPKTQLLPP